MVCSERTSTAAIGGMRPARWNMRSICRRREVFSGGSTQLRSTRSAKLTALAATSGLGRRGDDADHVLEQNLLGQFGAVDVVGQTADDHVDLPVPEGRNQGFVGALDDLDDKLGMFLAQTDDGGGQQHRRWRRQGPDQHAPGVSIAKVADVLGRMPELNQDDPRLVDKGFAVDGRHHALGRPVEELDPKLALGHLKGLCDGWLSHVEQLGRAHEALFVGDGHEQTEMTDRQSERYVVQPASLRGLILAGLRGERRQDAAARDIIATSGDRKRRGPNLSR